ncbi:AfsR/SARP family transcriptional regulator [Actinomadura alba]|uniref:Winged helix-turn-helix domain-containing protein n=1 Tax=Actinomadura alba TaxID=406431 RepID=A0ABR7LST7_9ACTN|nr:AfsR/SARP family transcriptional regulator [Actinomadura alba]MBC6467897.1 winged helix-turn-helix domain-containing protein [Actinomadura alba]
MEFALLGPLVVRTAAGRELPLKRAKHRHLLATLLLRPNTTVTTSLLIDHLWGEHPPPSARNNLKTYVWQLRRMLSALDHGRPHIETSGNGYQITARPDELDTLFFQELTRRGGQALRGGDIVLAEATLSRAVDLWRGDVLQDVTLSEPLRAWAAILTEERLGVLEDLTEARLTLGRHAEMIGPLRRAVRENPLRERLWAQLMLALYREGRSSEALQAYQDLRTHLIIEIGAEPGPAVRRLHQRMLAVDPELGTDRTLTVCGCDKVSPLEASASPRWVRVRSGPAELPSDAGKFVGRDGEMARLATLLSDPGTGRGSVIAIDGPAGVGKSRLAVRVAHAVASSYPDGQLYVNLHGATPGLAPLTPDEVLARFLRSLDAPDVSGRDGVDEAAALFRTRTAGRRMLIVLDNAVDAGQVRPLLPGGSESAVLVTGRTRLTTLDATVRVHLDILSERDAVDLLAAFAGPERIQRDPEVAARITELCGGLPLAVRIAGARLGDHPHWPIARLAAQLATADSRLDELTHGDLCVRTSLAAGHDLDRHPEAARLFTLLGLLDVAEFSASVAAALVDQGTDDVQGCLDTLVRARLLESRAPDRYHMHDLIRLFARERAFRTLHGNDRIAAARRALNCQLATSRGTLFLGVVRCRRHDCVGHNL